MTSKLNYKVGIREFVLNYLVLCFNICRLDAIIQFFAALQSVAVGRWCCKENSRRHTLSNLSLLQPQCTV